MKKLLVGFLFLIAARQCFAQTGATPQRHIKFDAFGKDSINLYLSDTYFLIEDSCASIIRCAHINYDTKKFFGKFKDISKANRSLVINEGNYNQDGLKDGDFVAHYLNGNLRAKGKFSNNKFIGTWEFYYEDGSPEVTFNIDDGITTIIDAWNSNKVKTVSNGNGHFVVDNGDIDLVWHGKITNGRPDSTWIFSNINDPHSPTLIEYFKKGKFIRGKNPMITYDDASHIVLINENLLPINNVERFAVAPSGCSPGPFSTATYKTNRHSIKSAGYFNGMEAFTGKISEVMTGLGNVRVDGADARIVIEGTIDEKGNIGEFVSNDKFDETISRRIISCLERLPQLIPATYDTMPAKQKFRITYVFNNYSYRFSYEFLGVIPPDNGGR